MRIRDLKFRGNFLWPPNQWGGHEPTNQVDENSIILRKAQLFQRPDRISITCEFAVGDNRTTIIFLEPIEHLKALYEKINCNKGRTLREIGDLEIDLSF